MDETYSDARKHSTSWETYKILNKIKETVQQKRKIAKDLYVSKFMQFHLKLID